MNARTTNFGLAGFVVLGGFLLSAATGQEFDSDPLPLKRDWIEPESLERRIQGRGVLIQMPLADFDALVEQARQSQRIGKALPSLAVSTYKADLIGNSLSGSGTWVVQGGRGDQETRRQGVEEKANPSSVSLFPGLLVSLSPLNLALNNVKNKTLGNDAVLGLFEGKSLALVVDKAGSQTITFDWSARGTTTPGGLHFDLRLPSCPQASIKLMLPADQFLSLPADRVAGGWWRVTGDGSSSLPPANHPTPLVGGALLSGPHDDTADPQKRLWQLDLTGKNQIELIIRPSAGSSDLSPTQLVQIVTRQEIAPDKIKADFEFQVDVPLHPVSELVFDCDPSLSPYEVSLPSAEILGWKLSDPSATKDKSAAPARLTIQLREPFQGTLTGLRIRCLAPRPADAHWVSPYVRLRQSVTCGETLKIHVHPEVPLERWDAGGFRLVSTSTGADGTMALTLEGKDEGGRMKDEKNAPAASSFRRPSFFGKSQAIQRHTRQQTWWHLGALGMTLKSDVAFEVSRGSLYQLVVRLPRTGNWRVERVDLEPPDLLQAWSTVARQEGKAQEVQEVTIDLTKGLTPGNQAKVSLRLNSPWEGSARPVGPLDFPFPDVEVPPPVVREGTLHIGVDPIFQASVLQHSVPFTSSQLDGPWGTPALFSFPFRDQMVSGQLRLVPSSARLQVVSRTQVTLLPKSAVVVTRLDIDPIMGQLEQCDFIVAGGGRAAWQARLEKPGTRTVRLLRLGVQEKLPVLLGLSGPGDPFSALSWPMLADSVEGLQAWRMFFSPPLTQRETVVLESSCQPRDRIWVAGGGWRVAGKDGESPAARQSTPGTYWDAPLPTVADTPRRQGEVFVQASGVSIGQVQVHGLDERTKTGTESAGQRRYAESAPLLPILTIQAAPAALAPVVQKYIERAHLSSRIGEDGRVFHHLSLVTADWHDKDIAVVLPDASSKVLGARVAGISLDDVGVQKVDKGLEVRIPVPRGGPRRVIDLYYSGEASRSGWPSWAHFDVSWPILPVAPLNRQRTWHLPPGLEPLRQDQWTNAKVPASLESSSLDLVRKTWHAGEPLLASWLPWTKEDNRQVQLLLAREITLRKAWPEKFTFGKALEKLVFDQAADPLFVVVDAAGLGAVGLAPDTPIGPEAVNTGRPFWENLGLVIVPCSSALVLTSPQQLKDWQGLFTTPRDLDQDVSLALAAGSDRKGLFQNVSYWVRHERVANEEDTPDSLATRHSPLTTVVWQPRAGQVEEPGFTAIRTADVRLGSYALGFFTLVLTLWMRLKLSGVGFFRALSIGGTACGLGVLWLPAPCKLLAGIPLVVALTVGLFAYGILLIRGVPRAVRHAASTQIKAAGSSSVAPLGLIMLLGVFWSNAQGGPLAFPEMQADAPREKTVANASVADKAQTVLIVRGRGPDGADRTTAYVTPELVQQLKDLARPPLDAQAEAMLMRGEYRGTVDGTLFDFRAEFDLYSFTAKSRLVLPLSGVDLLEGCTLDGDPVYPNALGGPQTGYELSISGKGIHRVRLHFTSRLHNQADFQELRFDIPKLVQSELRLTVPLAWKDVQVQHCQGEDRVLTKQGKKEIYAQLGPENVVQVRWRQDNSSSNAPRSPSANLEVQEAYLWDLRPSHFSLTGLINCTVTKGTLSQVQVAIPDNVEVRSVDLADTLTLGARIKKWNLAADGANINMRLLQIELAQPVTGKFQMVLSLVPSLALNGAMVKLRLPEPLSTKNEGTLPQRTEGWQGVVAYRTEGWETADMMENLVIDTFAPEQFVKVWQEYGQRDPGLPTQAYSFRRGVEFAALKVALQPVRPTAREEIAFHVHPAALKVTLQPIWPTAREAITFHVHPAFTDVAVRLQIRGKGQDVSFLECEVPAPEKMVLADVTMEEGEKDGGRKAEDGGGKTEDASSPPSVLRPPTFSSSHSVRWSRADQKVQIWLPRPAREANILLVGWFKNQPDQQNGEQVVRFDFRKIRPVQVRVQSCVVKFETEAGYELKLENPQGLVAWKEPLTYELSKDKLSKEEFFTGSAVLHVSALRPEVRVLTRAGLQNGVFSFSTHIDCQLPRSPNQPFTSLPLGVPHEETIVLKLRNWPADVQLDPAQAELKKEYRRVGNDHTWRFVLPAGQLWPISFFVRGQTSPGSGQKIDVPVMEVENADYRDQVLLLTGGEVKPVVIKGLAAVKNLPHALRFWPGELTRMSRESLTWEVIRTGSVSDGPAWQLQLQAPLVVLQNGRRHLLWSQHEIFQQDGCWVHQASYFIALQNTGEVQVLLPVNARFLAACWGEQFLHPRLDDAQHLTLNLAQEPTGQILRLRWQYPPGEESPAQLRLAIPVLQGMDEAASATTLWLPGDLSLPPQSRIFSEPLLPRGQALVQLARLLADWASSGERRAWNVERVETGNDSRPTTPASRTTLYEKIQVSQRFFHELARHADYELSAAAKVHAGEPQMVDAAQAAWHSLLKESERLTQQGIYDPLSAEKDAYQPDPLHMPSVMSLTGMGLPLFNFTADKKTPLGPADVRGTRAAIFYSQILIAGLLALLFVSFLRRLFWTLPALWPEQLMIVSLAGLVSLGISPLGVGLLLASVVARLIWVVRLSIGVARRLWGGTR